MRQLSEKERMDCQVIERLLSSYYSIVSKNIEDMVPKTIMYFMIEHVQKNFQLQLVKQLYCPELFDELLAENGDISRQRQNATEMLDALKRANIIIGEIRETQIR